MLRKVVTYWNGEVDHHTHNGACNYYISNKTWWRQVEYTEDQIKKVNG